MQTLSKYDNKRIVVLYLSQYNLIKFDGSASNILSTAIDKLCVQCDIVIKWQHITFISDSSVLKYILFQCRIYMDMATMFSYLYYYVVHWFMGM